MPKLLSLNPIELTEQGLKTTTTHLTLPSNTPGRWKSFIEEYKILIPLGEK